MAKSDAGAEVARPAPSRHGGPFDGCRPLQTFLEHLPAARTALTQPYAASFFFGVANLAPKLALEKLTLTKHPTGEALVIESPDGAVRFLPLSSDPKVLYGLILDALSARRAVQQVPRHMAENLGRVYAKTLQQKEYVIQTAVLQKLAGGRLANTRNLISRLKRDGAVVEAFDPGKLEDYMAVNQTWYRQNAGTKFRTYDKTSIDWMLQNWSELAASVPDLMCLGVRTREGQLLGFTIASLLSDDVWSAYTERFDRSVERSGANWLLWQHFAGTDLGARCAIENDGTADTPQLKRNKEKLSLDTIAFFKVAPK